jgi:hypothetical protein
MYSAWGSPQATKFDTNWHRDTVKSALNLSIAAVSFPVSILRNLHRDVYASPKLTARQKEKMSFITVDVMTTSAFTALPAHAFRQHRASMTAALASNVCISKAAFISMLTRFFRVSQRNCMVSVSSAIALRPSTVLDMSNSCAIRDSEESPAMFAARSAIEWNSICDGADDYDSDAGDAAADAQVKMS